MNILSVTDSEKYQIGTYNGKDLEQYYDPTYKSHFIMELKIDSNNVLLNVVLVVEDIAYNNGDFSNFQIEEAFENIRNNIGHTDVDNKLLKRIEKDLYAAADEYSSDSKVLTITDATHNHGVLYIINVND